jgi:hypothetical protein
MIWALTVEEALDRHTCEGTWVSIEASASDYMRAAGPRGFGTLTGVRDCQSWSSAIVWKREQCEGLLQLVGWKWTRVKGCGVMMF